MDPLIWRPLAKTLFLPSIVGLATLVGLPLIAYNFAQKLQDTTRRTAEQQQAWQATQAKLLDATTLLSDYQKFRRLKVRGEENRLDLAEGLDNLKTRLRIPVLQYRLAPQKTSWEKNRAFETLGVRGSLLHLDMTFRHDVDLLIFLQAMQEPTLRPWNGHMQNIGCQASRVDQLAKPEKPVVSPTGTTSTKTATQPAVEQTPFKLNVSCDYWLYTMPEKAPSMAGDKPKEVS
ncbi:MAG: hypothetical protein ACK5NY_02860 [Burkholderiaceae bacterium]|jgi:hypothetical protein